MRFAISSTHFGYENIANAYNVLKDKMTEENHTTYIEIENLDDFISVLDIIHHSGVIVTRKSERDNRYPEIEIYDDYRE